MRYQYLDLAYFLQYGKWVNASETPNIEIKSNDAKSWVEFFNYSHQVLQDYEECDCYRERDLKENTTIENRFFLDVKRNNSITYLQKFGDWDFGFSWDTSDVHNPHGNLVLDESQLNIKYHGPWVEMIRDYICKLNDPKPSVFVFNQGVWPNIQLLNEMVQDEIISALNDCNIRTIFKSNTKGRWQIDREFEEYETQLRNKTDDFMDVSWTGGVPTSLYADKWHVKQPINSLMNLQLLSILSSNDAIDF
jgi:hypothetical protein